jgi:hypothetical protein
LRGMITSLIFSGILGGSRRGLLQHGVDAHGSWRARLVEESNNIESLVLCLSADASVLSFHEKRINVLLQSETWYASEIPSN